LVRKSHRRLAVIEPVGVSASHGKWYFVVADDTRRRSAPHKRGPRPAKFSWTRTSEVRAQELASAGQGGVAFVEHRGESLEHVRDARCDFERDGDVGRRGTRGESGRVVEEDLV
jgi:hypothetical protein